MMQLSPEQDSPTVPQLAFSAHPPRMVRTSSLGALRALSEYQEAALSPTATYKPLERSEPEHAPSQPQVGLGLASWLDVQGSSSDRSATGLSAETPSSGSSPSLATESPRPYFTPSPPDSYRFPEPASAEAPPQFASYPYSQSASSSRESLIISPSAFPLPPSFPPPSTALGSDSRIPLGLEQRLGELGLDPYRLNSAPEGDEMGIKVSRKASRTIETVEEEQDDEILHRSLARRPLGSSPSNPLPARPDRSSRRPSAASSIESVSPSFTPSPTSSRLLHSASLPSLSSHLNLKADKRSSFLGLVLGRKKSTSLGGTMSPPLASPPPMYRSNSGQPYESVSARPGLLEVEEDEEGEDEDDEAPTSSPPPGEVRISNKAAALLGLQDGDLVSPPRSAPMSPSNSRDSSKAPPSKLQRGSSRRVSSESDRRRRGSGSEHAVHTYEHDPLPLFPCTMGAVLDYELASDTLYRHAHTHHVIRSNRPSAKDWRPQHLVLSNFPSPLTDPPSTVLSLHYFRTPAARDDHEIARLELTARTIVCVPEEDLALGGSSKVAAAFALKVTGLAPRDTDDHGRPLNVEREEESWIIGMSTVEEMARWLKVLKEAVKDLQERAREVASASPERERRTRQMSVRSVGSARSSTASFASSVFESSGTRLDRRPSQTPSTTHSMSPQSRKQSIPGNVNEARLPLIADEMELHIRAAPASAEDDEDEEEPATAHPYGRAALTPPTPKSPSRRRPSSSISRDSVSSANSLVSSTSSQRLSTRPPPPASPLPPLPPGPPRTSSDPTAILHSSRRLSVMTSSTTTSSDSSSSLQSRLSAAPLPPQAPPPTMALPPPPPGHPPFRPALDVPKGLGRSVSEPKDVHAEARSEERENRRPPTFTSAPLPPPPTGSLPPLPVSAPRSAAPGSAGSVRARAQKWEQSKR